jgi:hypothetical protein
MDKNSGNHSVDIFAKIYAHIGTHVDLASHLAFSVHSKHTYKEDLKAVERSYVPCHLFSSSVDIAAGGIGICSHSAVHSSTFTVSHTHTAGSRSEPLMSLLLVLAFCQ